MFGGNLPDNDEFTLSLITNKDVLYVNKNSTNNRQIFRENDLIIWAADDSKSEDKFVAFFNAMDQDLIDENKALWESENITNSTPGQSVDIDLDITGAKKLVLVASFDEAERFASHNVTWIDPVITTAGGKIRLTEREWVSATSSRGTPSVNKTMQGGKLIVDGKEYNNGINSNATSIIEYELPEGALRFQAKAGINGATLISQRGQQPDSPGQRPASARFLVFTQDPEGPVPADSVEIPVRFDQLGISGTHSVKNLWTGEKLGTFTDSFSYYVNNHGAGLFRIH
jgi:hypothetical protein